MKTMADNVNRYNMFAITPMVDTMLCISHVTINANDPNTSRRKK